MFTALTPLAQLSTLLITIGAEGDQLRVNITPTPKNPDDEQHLRPLSLLATPQELDADFAAAIAVWQAPRQSVLEQAEAAAGDQSSTDKQSAKPAAKESAPKAAPKKKAKPAKTATTATAKTTLNPAASWPFPNKKATDGIDPAASDAASTEGDATTDAADATTGTADATPGDEGDDTAPDTAPAAAPETPPDTEPAADASAPSPDAATASPVFSLDLF